MATILQYQSEKFIEHVQNSGIPTASDYTSVTVQAANAVKTLAGKLKNTIKPGAAAEAAIASYKNADFETTGETYSFLTTEEGKHEIPSLHNPKQEATG